MNRKFIGFAALALTVMVTSCSKNEMTESFGNGNTGELVFKTVTQKPLSRATETTLLDLEGAGVDVFALITNDAGATYSSYFDDVLAHSVSGWTPTISAKRYLKVGYTNRFFSVYPSGSVSNLADNDDLTGAYLAADALKFHYATIGAEDLLGAASAAYTESDVSNDQSGTSVTLPFNHLLAQASVGVKLDNTTIGNVILTDISFNQVGSSGDYTFGTEGIGVNNWDNTTLDNYGRTGSINTETDTQETTVTGGAFLLGGSGDFAADMAAKSLMLVPATFVTSTITFQFQAFDLFGTEITNGAMTGTIDLDATSVPWNQGLRYIYLIDFTNWFLNRELKFTVTVANWENHDWSNVPAAGTGIVDVTP